MEKAAQSPWRRGLGRGVIARCRPTLTFRRPDDLWLGLVTARAKRQVLAGLCLQLTYLWDASGCLALGAAASVALDAGVALSDIVLSPADDVLRPLPLLIDRVDADQADIRHLVRLERRALVRGHGHHLLEQPWGHPHLSQVGPHLLCSLGVERPCLCG